MAAFGGGSGTQGPAYGPSGPALTTVNLMSDLRPQRGLLEDFAVGVGKAHRQVCYSHGEHRNVRRAGPLQRAVIR